MKLFLHLLFLSLFCLLAPGLPLSAQEELRSLSMEEYHKAKTFTVNDLDKDTYLKIDNTYILDKGNMPPPYFITGDDGLRKRIDLYQLIDKPSKEELGTLIYYTNEQGRQFTALLPTVSAGAEVWNQYFEDIHDIDREETDYVLKLSYVLSRELSKAMAGEKAPAQSLEGATYGTEICFPGHQLLQLADGSRKPLAELQPGDKVLAYHSAGQQARFIPVSKLKRHKVSHYALVRLQLFREKSAHSHTKGYEVVLSSHSLEATPNHPLQTGRGVLQAGKLLPGDQLWVMEDGKPRLYTVGNKHEFTGPQQAVYSLELMLPEQQPVLNEVVVLQKEK